MQTASCFLDLFCLPRSHVEIDTLRSIVTCTDPRRYGLWERLVLEKYGRFMPNMVTRRIRFATTRTKDPLLDITFLFFVFMGFEHACQRVIVKQLERAECVKDHKFFTEVFVKFARNNITIFLRQPITRDDARHALNMCVTLLQLTWSCKTTYFLTISTRYEIETRDKELRRRTADEKPKDPLRLPPAGRAKRTRG